MERKTDRVDSETEGRPRSDETGSRAAQPPLTDSESQGPPSCLRWSGIQVQAY
jgi:hypothetical protein